RQPQPLPLSTRKPFAQLAKPGAQAVRQPVDHLTSRCIAPDATTTRSPIMTRHAIAQLAAAPPATTG
ncbi:MAG: hypothetical protein RSB04_12870, partial [Gordonibacter sp.]|uniref:hypothetical protein n=1 Tax=Gordonibacter sp. TaxID=1968902 RepID=UPI002FCC48DF